MYMDEVNIEEILSNTIKQGDCLVYNKKPDSEGYIVLNFTDGKVRAHRLVYRLAYGPIAAKMVIDHKCFNRACVKPEHLREVTRKQNSENREKAERGAVLRPSGRWSAQCKHEGVYYSNGTWDTKEQALEAARELRNRLFTHNELDRVP